MEKFTPNPFIKPLAWASIALGDVIARGLRLEAAAHNIQHHCEIEKLNQSRCPMVELFPHWANNVHHAPRFRRVYATSDSKYAVPLFLPSQINDVYPQAAKWMYSTTTRTDINYLRVHENQLLVARSGTIGECALVGKSLKGKIYSDDLIRIDAKLPGYLYAFFKSRIGRILVSGKQYGGVIKHIEPLHLRDLRIPNPPPAIQKKIHNLIKKSFDLRDDSNALMENAWAQLQTALSLPPLTEIVRHAPMFRQATVNNFSVPVSRLEGRFDASYHLPVVHKITKILAQNAAEITTVADQRISAKIILPGRFKRVYVSAEQGHPFIGGKQINQIDPASKKYLSYHHHEARIRSQLMLSEGMTLITCSGTVGKVSIVPKHWEKFTANQHIIRVVPADKNIGGYLHAWLSSPYARPLIERFIYGAVVDEIDHRQVKEIAVPILKDAAVQKTINDSVLLANKKRTEAFDKEQRAMQMMEEVFK